MLNVLDIPSGSLDPLIAWVFRQVRKPSGALGRRAVRAMNLSHSKMTDWGLHPRNAAILDVGCGGGETVNKLATLAPDGKVVRLDYSAVQNSRPC